MSTGFRPFCFTVAAVLVSPAALLPQTPTNPPNQSGAAELVRQGRRLSNEGKQTEALALYEKAAREAPESFEAQLAAGTALDLEGRYAGARQHLAKAIELAPAQSKVQALKAMAISYAFERNCKEATKYERQAFDSQVTAQDYNAAAETADELARICLESGDLDNAYEWYKNGHETAFRKPNMTAAEQDLWNFRWEHAQARIAARRGEKEEAERHVAAAKALLDRGTNPDQARFFPYLTGYVALYTGDSHGAITDFQKADQRDPFILILLAQAYEKSGDEAHAKECYRKALSSNAHNPTNAFARPVAREKLK
ncbi:MAG TPA: tetratricopeptide repeat protein [Bryobacteraceae bacterium]|nr:tetratricopeptide repeat protein [Bryobacteraceae bacterium]